MSNSKDFCRLVIWLLKDHPNFAELFVKLKMKFCRQYQSGLIFSTRFGADFFSEVYNRLENKEYLKPEIDSAGKVMPLGEFDINFNRWLKNEIETK